MSFNKSFIHSCLALLIILACILGKHSSSSELILPGNDSVVNGTKSTLSSQGDIGLGAVCKWSTLCWNMRIRAVTVCLRNFGPGWLANGRGKRDNCSLARRRVQCCLALNKQP